MTRKNGRPPLPLLAAVAVVLVCIGVNLWFYRQVNAPPNFDEAWYLEISCRLYYALRDQGLAAFYRTYADAFLFKAPLISVLPLPFYLLLGVSRLSALWVNIAAMIFLSIYLYLLGKKFFSETAGALAVGVAMTMPMLYGLSRMLLVEYALSAVVTATAYHLLASQGLKSSKDVRAVGLLAGAGLLLKTLYPAYLLGPFADVLRRVHIRKPNGFLKEVEPPLKTIAALAGAVALTWYAHNLLYAVGYIFRASVGDIASHYGSQNVFAPQVVFNYLDAFLEDGPSYYYAAAGMLFAAVFCRKERGRPLAVLRRAREHPALPALLSWLLIPPAVATLGVNKDIRFLTPCLPAAALLLGSALDVSTRGARWRPALLVFFFLVPADQYVRHAFGAGLLPETSLGPFRLITRDGNYAGPPAKKGNIGQERLVDELNALAAGGKTVFAFGAEAGHFNANTLSYLSALKNYPVSFVSYGYEYRRVERTVARLRDKGVDYLILIDGMPEDRLPENVRLLDAQIRALIRQGKLPFAPARTILLDEDVRAAVYRRTGEIRAFGAPAGKFGNRPGNRRAG